MVAGALAARRCWLQGKMMQSGAETASTEDDEPVPWVPPPRPPLAAINAAAQYSAGTAITEDETEAETDHDQPDAAQQPLAAEPVPSLEDGPIIVIDQQQQPPTPTSQSTPNALGPRAMSGFRNARPASEDAVPPRTDEGGDDEAGAARERAWKSERDRAQAAIPTTRPARPQPPKAPPPTRGEL